MTIRSTLSRRVLLQASAAAFGATLLAAPALATEDLAALYERAKEEGSLLFYASNHPDLTARLVAGFQAEYPGIEVEVVRLATGALGKRFATEKEAGSDTADVLQIGDATFVADAEAKGWFSPLAGLPSYDAWSADFKTDASALISLSPTMLTYNTDLVKPEEVPTDWKDLLNPRWKGKLIAVDPRVGTSMLDFYVLMEETYGPEFLTGLAAQEVKWVASNVPGVQMLAAGEGEIVYSALKQVTFTLQADGAPIENVSLEPTIVNETLISVVEGAKHPNAAKLFVDYSMRQDAQIAYNAGVNASPLPDLPGVDPVPASYRKLDAANQSQAERIYKALGLN